MSVVNSATSCDQRLGQDLATKDALALLVWLDATKEIDLNGFEI